MCISSAKNGSLIIALLVLVTEGLFAQNAVAQLKHKKCLLKGKWQLVQTFTDSALHKVDKAEYDAVVHFKVFHRFTEEVRYEGYHWIIEGKWRTYRHKATLLLTERKYTLGSLGDTPKDISFELSELSKADWTGNTTAENEPVKMFYRKIKRR